MDDGGLQFVVSPSPFASIWVFESFGTLVGAGLVGLGLTIWQRNHLEIKPEVPKKKKIFVWTNSLLVSTIIYYVFPLKRNIMLTFLDQDNRLAMSTTTWKWTNTK